MHTSLQNTLKAAALAVIITGSIVGCSSTEDNPTTTDSADKNVSGPVDVYSFIDNPDAPDLYLFVTTENKTYEVINENGVRKSGGELSEDRELLSSNGASMGSVDGFNYLCAYDGRGSSPATAMLDACGFNDPLVPNASDSSPEPSEVEDMTGDAVREPSPNSPPEGRATPAMEDEARQAVGDYYDAVNDDDWAYTYAHLDDETQEIFTEAEWARRNQWFEDNYPTISEPLTVEVHPDNTEPYAVVERTLILEYTDTAPIREARFVYEDGEWVQHLSGETLEQFMPGASFEEFVEANGGTATGS